jgi:hypothetical protein
MGWLDSKEIQSALIIATATLLLAIATLIAPFLHQDTQKLSIPIGVGKDSTQSEDKAKNNPSVPTDKTESENPHILIFLHLGQFVVLGFLVMDLWRRRKERKKELEDKPAVKQFLYYWIFIWVLGAMLYLGKLSIEVLGNYALLDPKGITAYVINAFISNVAPAFFFLVFFTLDVPSVDPDDLPFRRCRERILLILIAVELTAVSTLLVSEMREISDWIGSIWAGLAIAFLSGKLDAKVMEAHRPYIAIAYFYALIQVLAPFMDPSYSYAKAMPIWFKPTLFILALGGKVALFLIVVDLLDKGKIEKYLDYLAKTFPQKANDK